MRILVGRNDHPAQNLGEFLWIAAAQVLEHITKSSACSETDDRRRRQRHHGAALDLTELRPQPGDHFANAEVGALALLERLERDDHEAGIGLRIIVDEIQSDDRGVFGNGRVFLHDRLGLAHDFRGSSDRSSARQLDNDEYRALVILRHKSRRRHPG